MTPDEIRDTITQLQSDMDQDGQKALDALTKPWWQSRSVWGAVIVVLAQFARLIEVDLPVEAMTDAALSVATLIGAVMAWWGRVRAERPINLTRILPGVRVQ